MQVCHVIIYIQEGSRFETQILKKFRVLQAAKNALTPYVRTRSTPPLPIRPHSSSPSRPKILVTSSSSSSPGRSGGISGRNASAVSLMSGLGSYASLFPGQCTPVTLFVFIDDFSDTHNPNTIVEESIDNSSLSQSSSLSSLNKPTLPVKGSGSGSGSVLMLARPLSKSEGSFRKKLQSSLEAHVRFLIKKCRTLSGSESSHAGTRGGGVLSSAPLFSLDASRAVVLLDRTTNQSGESLEFAISLVEDVLNGVASTDSLLLESHSQNASKEDILLVKEFIYRQSDILRGRGGLATNANSGSAAGVGMVAVAAAAAAASAASGKTLSTPELPSLDIWLSSSQLILQGVLSAKRGCVDETEVGKRKPRQMNTVPPQVEGIISRGTDPLDIAVSLLESGGGLNKKFSTLWCERSLPAAKEIYLKDLPACYPTSQHEAHMEKALQAFHSMVRGPAVPLFAKMLEDECKSVWESGRQLCDAVSLTGKPCMHQRHNVGNDESQIGTAVKSHSSGYVFLHACACGRSRRLLSDPFDFESANKTPCFSDCDELLPKVQLPEVSPAGPIRSSSWSLIRVGGSRYYEPSNGLLQSGFSATHKFLLKWTILLEKKKTSNDLPARALQQGSVIRLSAESKIELDADLDIKKVDGSQVYTRDMNVVENQRKPSENSNSNVNKISFGRGIPNFMMRKPFSEVVAGSAATDSKFPPLQQRKQPSAGSEKGVKESMEIDRSVERTHANVDQGSKKSEDITSVPETLNEISSSGRGGDPFLRIGSNVVPVNINGAEKVKLNPTWKQVIVYVGFEHECPRGHRFLLNPEHLNELGSSYSLLEESHASSSTDALDHDLANSSKLGKNGSHGKVHRTANGVTAATAVNKLRGVRNSKEIVANGNLNKHGLIKISQPGKEQNHAAIGVVPWPNHVKDLEGGLQSISLGDNGCAFSMLNRNLPVYLNCPHCRVTKNKKDPPKIKFAGTISQLQRIFLVTPPFPIVLATCPVVQFEASCLPPLVPSREQKLQFSLGCRVILPPESFLALRLPFVYGVQLEDGSLQSLNPFEHEPEKTAWITKGTTLQVMSKGSSNQTY
ncbi:Smg8/Smg9 [Melia azedarach]|uniref:Smg8/Smg9 n=1 Tax=Melia azedarach TaxID=155640 RepID=A0ACC1YPC7_MELAZ|nr:Smg8/Smg9 [Melia azedarach]